MPSALPTTDSTGKAVNTFGIGTYDSQRDSEGGHGEDSEEREPKGKTLPDDGGPLDPFGPDRLLSYPQEYTSQGKHASAILPGDTDRPPTRRRITDETTKSPVETVAEEETADSELPSDADNPPARSGYYDRMRIESVEDIWSKEDSGAYTSQKKVSDSALPGVDKNEVSMDDFLGALGNYWSGYEVEDVSGPQGFPTEDFKENIEYDRSDNQDGGRILASQNIDRVFEAFSGIAMETPMNLHLATDLPLVAELTKEFIKDFGKKNLTRRHVMAFLQDGGRPQYLASDIIRCLKHDHKLVIPDVLDTFPIAKTASDKSGIAGVRNRLIELQLENIQDLETASALGRCAANLAHVMAALEKFDGR